MASSSPAPIVIPPSQDFDGNDGPWSSFYLQVGTTPQDVKALISTAGYQTWVVLPQGCLTSDPADCATARGGQFIPSQSSTWKYNNASINGTFNLGLETNLDYSGNGNFGYDTVVLGYPGSNGPSLQQQIVAGIATKEFFLGNFGLNPRSTNFSTFNDPVPSYMATLKDKSLIPSLSWAYTAGNQYRPGSALGSLTLGGFDSSRFLANDVTFPFNQVDDRDLTVEIGSILMATGNDSVQLLNTSIAAFVDSTVPYFYFPLNICQQFEGAFGILWDNDVQAYLVNDTLHSSLQSQNATVIFNIVSSKSSVNISLPYAAFDLIAEYPLVTNTTRYFPLMRATNESQYTLGRAFLQEAYLIADYERRNFSISQCSWNSEAQEDIVTIESPTKSVAKGKPTTGGDTDALSSGRIAGIVVGSTFSLVFLIFLAFMGKRKFKRPGVTVNDTLYPHQDKALDENSSALERWSIEKYELDGQMYLGTELEADRERQEMESNEEAANELAVAEFEISELPA